MVDIDTLQKIIKNPTSANWATPRYTWLGVFQFDVVSHTPWILAAMSHVLEYMGHPPAVLFVMCLRGLCSIT